VPDPGFRHAEEFSQSPGAFRQKCTHVSILRLGGASARCMEQRRNQLLEHQETLLLCLTRKSNYRSQHRGLHVFRHGQGPP